MTQTFTRQELYDLVWSVPISTLAAKYGLSDRGLAKICERHHIPVPGRGHWARVEAGQKVIKTPLWKLDNPKIRHVTLGWRHPEAIFVREATQRARAQQAAPATAGNPQPVAKKSASMIKPQPKISLRHVEAGLHPSLTVFAKELRSAPADREGGIGVRQVRIHRDMIQRVLALLNTLAYELEPLGINFSSAGRWLEFLQGSAAVHFELTSPKKRIITERHGWRSHSNVFVGRLALQLYGQAEGVSKNWIDRDEKKIESDLPKIVASVRLNLAVKAEIDERRRKEERRHAYYAQRKELEKKRLEREKARGAFLDAVAEDRLEVQQLVQTIALLPANARPAPEFARMLEWARSRLATLEERTTPGAIQRALEDKRLFPNPDDLADPGEYREDCDITGGGH